MTVKEHEVEDVEESVEDQWEWVTIGGERMQVYFVNDGPSTHEQYLRFLEFQERRKNDSQRKKV